MATSSMYVRAPLRSERGGAQRAPQAEVNFTASAVDPHALDLSLDGLLVQRPAATFFLRVQGDGMKGAGILPGALLVVDRSLSPHPGGIVVACVDGDLAVRRVTSLGGRLHLEALDPELPPSPITEADTDVVIWGVVAYAINDLR